MSEMKVGVRNLKARLSDYLRQVRHGQVIVITDHGKTVGRILPAETSMDDLIKTLQAAGLMDWNGTRLMDIHPPAKNRGPKSVSDLLVEMRE
jgi:prevent-host-death family protein